MPDLASTEREVQAFVSSLLENGQIERGTGRPGAAAAASFGGVARSRRGRRGATADVISRETHRVESSGRKKVLVRVRFHCPCGG
jgi:hypothetical protein